MSGPPPYYQNMPAYQGLSEEDQRILREAHQKLDGNEKQVIRDAYQQQNNPNHPAHPQHHEHGKFKAAMEGIASKLGNAAIFGFGATAGADLFNHLF